MEGAAGTRGWDAVLLLLLLPPLSSDRPLFGPLVDEKGRAQKAGTPPQTPPPPPPTHSPNHPQPNLGPSDKSPPGPGMSIMPCGRVWPLLCASDFSLTAGYHHCLLSLHLGHNGGEGAHQRKEEWKTTTVEFSSCIYNHSYDYPKLTFSVRLGRKYLNFDAMLCGSISINQLGHANGALTNSPEESTID